VNRALQEKVVLLDTIITNNHAWQAVIRPYEYIIGRLNGNFHVPKDPLTYRSRMENTLLHPNPTGNNIHFTSKLIADNTQQPQKVNNDNNTFRRPIRQPCEAYDDKLPPAVNPSEKIFELMLEYEELNILLKRCYRPEYVRELPFLAVNCLDETLEFLRTLDRIRSTYSHTTSFNNIANYAIP
jgi:hypothetical protein